MVIIFIWRTILNFVPILIMDVYKEKSIIIKIILGIKHLSFPSLHDVAKLLN